MPVCRFGGNDSEGVRGADGRPGHGIAEAFPESMVCDDDVGGVQAGQIEGLGGPGANDGVIGELSGQGREGKMLEVLVNQVVVYFVRNYDYAAFEAKLPKPSQFLFPPDAA